MSHKGYGFESEIENFFLEFTDQTKRDPILKANKEGLIQLNRTFRIPTSGAMESMKGDVLTAIKWLPKQFKVECKSRMTKSKTDGQIILVERDWIRKNEEEAQVDSQIPLLCFSFKRVKQNRIWWIVLEKDYLKYFDSSHNATKITIKQGKTLKFVYNALKKPVYSYRDEENKEKYLLISHKHMSKLLKSLKVRRQKNV